MYEIHLCSTLDCDGWNWLQESILNNSSHKTFDWVIYIRIFKYWYWMIQFCNWFTIWLSKWSIYSFIMAIYYWAELYAYFHASLTSKVKSYVVSSSVGPQDSKHWSKCRGRPYFFLPAGLKKVVLSLWKGKYAAGHSFLHDISVAKIVSFTFILLFKLSSCLIIIH